MMLGTDVYLYYLDNKLHGIKFEQMVGPRDEEEIHTLEWHQNPNETNPRYQIKEWVKKILEVIEANE